MLKKTKQNYEQLLNNSYNEVTDEIVKQFAHLGNRKVLEKHHYNNTFGTFLRRKDPLFFSIIYNEWCRK